MGETIAVWVPAVLTVVAALLANGAGLLLWRVQRRKVSADAAGVITDQALKMVERMEGQVEDLTTELQELKAEYTVKIKELEDRVAVLERENERLRRGVTRLEGQIMAMGQEPVWKLSESGKQEE